VNGAIVQFHGFAEAEATGNVLYQLPSYMLVKLLHDPGMKISIPPLQPSIVPIKTVKFTHNRGHGRSVTLEQFPVTLAYAITDYKCQGKTFKSVIVDLKTPSGPGASSPMSAYVQLSRATALDRISIIRPFNEKDLWEPLSQELVEELQWQEEMAKRTAYIYV